MRLLTIISLLKICRCNPEDEIGAATTALNRMKNNLGEVIQSIAGTAEHVASASEEISSSATSR